MYQRTRNLIDELEARFGYTRDNNDDLISDSTFSQAELAEELEVARAYQYITGYLIRCDGATDKACWGD